MSIPHLKYRRHNDPKAIRPDMLTTPEARAAYEKLNSAVAAYVKLVDSEEVAKSKASTARTSYATALKEAAVKGEDLGKIPAPREYEVTPAVIAQAEAHIHAANTAASELRQALVDNLDTAIEATLAELEQHAQNINTILDTLDQAIRDYRTADTRRGIYRTLQQYPDELPLTGSTVNTDKFQPLFQAVRNALSWQADDLTRQAKIEQAKYRATGDEQHITRAYELAEQRNTLL